MGLAIYVETDTPLSSIKPSTHMDGKALGHAEELLEDELFKELSVTPISEFFDHTENIEELDESYDEDDEEESDEEEKEGEWFDPEDALATVHALIEYLEDESDNFDRVDEILQDLEAFEEILESCINEGARFHLCFDF